MKKKFVILVKSIKNSQNCVAGREIECAGNGIRVLDNWIRPISARGENGSVSDREIIFSDAKMPRFLDVIQIDVVGNEGKTTQPENWILTDKPWIKMGSIPLRAVADTLAQRPENLWLGSNCKSDRISPIDYLNHGYNSSICIVEPEGLQLRISSEIHNDIVKKYRRLRMNYNEVEYDLAITDTDIDKKYFTDFPPPQEGERAIELDSNRCLVAISLAPEWHGYHYKIVGKIIEL